ncbi:TPA: LysR family transcriptional regulator, partial [Klebsiella pneumoniae]|nr:LysR family transcriptional regulator [Klebsiella pneumoniae]
PLATQPTLALEQLRDVAPILFPREVAPGLYELVYNSCLRAGIDMERAWQSSQISSSLSMVNAGFGFALVPQSMTCIQQPKVSYHPLSGAPLKTDIAIAWRRFERSRTVKRFLAMF